MFDNSLKIVKSNKFDRKIWYKNNYIQIIFIYSRLINSFALLSRFIDLFYWIKKKKKKKYVNIECKINSGRKIKLIE